MGFGRLWGGLITFLATRLTRYSLGLAATLSTLLLLGGFWGGLITFLAACLTRYSLGLAATLSTLLLHRTLHSSLAWGVLGGADNVLGCPPYEINGHHKMSQGVHSMIQQWMWRQTILPCSPKELMSCLVDLLKKYHDFK